MILRKIASVLGEHFVSLDFVVVAATIARFEFVIAPWKQVLYQLFRDRLLRLHFLQLILSKQLNLV